MTVLKVDRKTIISEEEPDTMFLWAERAHSSPRQVTNYPPKHQTRNQHAKPSFCADRPSDFFAHRERGRPRCGPQ